MFKKFSLWFCVSLFLFSVFGVIILTNVATLARPNYIKSWTQKSGLYESLPSALLSQAGKEEAKQQDKSEDVSFSNPLVQEAAKSALTPDFLKQSTEQIVNGSFKWLEGSIAKPDFSIDVSSVKQSFADSLGNLLKKRYEALPACAATQLPSTTDPFTIDCRPAVGLDIDQVVTSEKNKLLNNEDFLPDKNLTADNINIGGDNDPQKLSDNKDIPKAYQLFHLLPVIFGGLALLSGIGVIFLASSKRVGLRKIGWRLSLAGFLSLILFSLGALGLTKVSNLATTQGADAAVTAYKDILAKGLTAIRTDSVKLGAITAGITLILGVVLLVVTRDKEEKTDKKSESKTPDLSATKKETPAQKPVTTKPAAQNPPTAPVVTPRPKAKRNLIQ